VLQIKLLWELAKLVSVLNDVSRVLDEVSEHNINDSAHF